MTAAHADLVNRLLLALSSHGCLVVKFNTGQAVTRNGYTIRFGCEGWADIIGCTPAGRFLAVEVKTGKGRLRDKQKAFRDAVVRHGGIHIEARSVEQVMGELEAGA